MKSIQTCPSNSLCMEMTVRIISQPHIVFKVITRRTPLYSGNNRVNRIETYRLASRAIGGLLSEWTDPVPSTQSTE